VIFSDRSLEDMARRRPRTVAEFGSVFGVGEAKLRDLAATFLEAIAGHGTAAGPAAGATGRGDPAPGR
jgi:ATP-dependent DNA helicase RecQ